MTTIAVNREGMACDSLISWGEGEFATCDDKVIRIGDELVGSAGDTANIFKFLEWYRRGGERPEVDGDKSFEVVILSKKGIYIFVNSTYPMRLGDAIYATGSGAMAAKAAMLCGKTPEEAVAIAIKCDKNSGGKVRSYLLADL